MIVALIVVAWILINALFVCRRLLAAEMRERRHKQFEQQNEGTNQ